MLRFSKNSVGDAILPTFCTEKAQTDKIITAGQKPPPSTQVAEYSVDYALEAELRAIKKKERVTAKQRAKKTQQKVWEDEMAKVSTHTQPIAR